MVVTGCSVFFPGIVIRAGGELCLLSWCADAWFWFGVVRGSEESFFGGKLTKTVLLNATDMTGTKLPSPIGPGTTGTMGPFRLNVTKCAFMGFSLRAALGALRHLSVRCLYVGSFRLPLSDGSSRVGTFRSGYTSCNIAKCTINPVCVGDRTRVSHNFRCTGQMNIGAVINMPGCRLLPCISGGIGRCSFGCTVRLRKPSVGACPSTASI